VRQLKKITLAYCEHGGSSQGLRTFLASSNRKEIQDTNPHIEFVYRKSNGRHPLLIAEYQNGVSTPISLRNLEIPEIRRFIDYVNNRRGGPHRNWTERRRHVTDRPSIQGFWHPDQWFGVYRRKDE